MHLSTGWQGADLALFDCDSTLTRLEGIDELARRRGVDVSALTSRAMAGELPIEDVYGLRLERIKPVAGDLEWLAERYWDERVDGIERLIGTLRASGVACHVVSGGLLPAVAPQLDSELPAEAVEALHRVRGVHRVRSLRFDGG